MKKYILFITLIAFYCMACNKESFTTNKNAYLYTQLPLAGDTLSFDTIFTSVGSVTQSFMIKNGDKKSIHIDNIKLFGGENSFFAINVNGQSGTDFGNIDLAAGDSLYVFVMANVKENNSTNPFKVLDSIGYSFNGNQNKVYLQAYGQNAFFLKTQTINHDTIWSNQLPIVLSGNTTVAEGATLTIQKGTRIYAHAKTVFQVNGKLIANGGTDTADRILFTNDRLDYPYNESTNQWRGINFGAASTGNTLENVTIKNADIGIADTLNNSSNSTVRLTLNGCIITNHNYAALYLRNSNANISNSLIINSNAQIVLENGGNYSFNYCTIAGYDNDYVSHNNSSLVVSNDMNNGAASALQATFTNCILYGDNNQTDEIKIDEQAQSNIAVKFVNSLYKLNSALSGITFSNSIQNADPLFLLIDDFHNQYDFRLNAGSPAIGAAVPNSITTDITGQSRDAQKPTIGCFEFKD